MNRTQMLAMLVIALATSSVRGQATWNEIGDAPEGPLDITGHQETLGIGPLEVIEGSLDGVIDHVDTYSIIVEDPTLFSAQVPSPSPRALGSHRMWLWNDTTRGPGLVMANDLGPSCAVPGCTLLTDPDFWPAGPGGLVDNPGNVVAGGKYLLSVSYGENDPLDAMLTPLAALDGNPLALVGPSPNAGAFANWENPGGLNEPVYRILLTGVTFSMVPEPTSSVTIMVALLMPLCTRRRWHLGK